MTPDSPAPCPVLAKIRPNLLWEVWQQLGVSASDAAGRMGVTEAEAAEQLAAASGRNSLRLVRPETIKASYSGRGKILRTSSLKRDSTRIGGCR